MTWHECRLTGVRLASVQSDMNDQNSTATSVVLRIKFLAWMVDDSRTLVYLAATGTVWNAALMNHVEEGWV